jgi:thiol-disulfide isomerase/thioredoxin
MNIDRRRPLGRLASVLTAVALFFNGSCAQPAHGRITSMSVASRSDYVICEHRVPEEACVRCHPEQRPKFEARGDWCREHDVPESQCLECNPDLDFAPPKEPPAGADVKTIVEDGRDLPALEPYLVPGKVTLFDFGARWCPPCRKVDEHLFPRLSADVAIRKIDVGAWDTPVAERWLSEVPELPYLIVYDKNGQRRAAISGAKLSEIDRAIQEARR